MWHKLNGIIRILYYFRADVVYDIDVYVVELELRCTKSQKLNDISYINKIV